MSKIIGRWAAISIGCAVASTGRAAVIGAAALMVSGPVMAQTPPAALPAVLAPPSMTAFENAYAVSFYGFDACGDQIAGRMFRNALAERFAHCPFSPEARAHFKQWSTAQRRASSRAIAQLVDQTGGMPVKLDGMSKTCREQRASPDYTALRDKLEKYASGSIPAEAVIPQSCDSPALAP